MKQEDKNGLEVFRSPPKKDLITAVALTILIHIILFTLNLSFLGKKVYVPQQSITILRQLASPPSPPVKIAPPKVVPPKPKKEKIKKPVEKKVEPKPVLIPIPDPTPLAPEPIKKEEPTEEELPIIVEEINDPLDIGEIEPPPTSDKGDGKKKDPGQQGYAVGDPGVTAPVLLLNPIPHYTDAAIKAKIEGTVILEVIILPNGLIDSNDIRIIEKLGYGLEEKAIETIINRWKFKPGTKDGKPVSIIATIEIEFNLR